jgi:asparagine N-glycosylation enzyme membrane subunit Stt3
VNIWLTGAIGVAVVLLAAAYIVRVRIDGSRMHRAAPAVIALAVLAVAVNELVVIPTWGVDVGTRAASAFFWCVILPAAAYLSSRRTR